MCPVRAAYHRTFSAMLAGLGPRDNILDPMLRRMLGGQILTPMGSILYCKISSKLGLFS